jgi:hypothetical protein
LKQIRSNDGSVVSNQKIKSDKNVTKKMSDEEKQLRLAEMQQNAKWRNDVRSSNINKYKSEEHNEKRLQDESNTDDSKVEASQYFK